jgi:heme-degrading monooxygenase HmoA
MYTRVVTFTGAKNIDGGIAFVRERVVPILNEQKGYRGLSASADRSGGVLGVLSLWETEADRGASDSALAKAREEGLDIVGGEMTVETFEQLVAEVSAPPVAGSALMVTRISMDPAKIDENLAFFKSEIVPRIKATPGFLALRQMMDRKTGRGIVGSAWVDQDAMKAAAADAQARRQEGVARGVEFGEVSYREIVFVDLR